MRPTHSFREFRSNDFLANIGFIAFSPVACAVIVDVTSFLDFADKGAAAVSAIHKARESKVSWITPKLGRVALIEDELNPIEELARDKRLVASLIGSVLPTDLAHIDRVAQDRMNLADRHMAAGYARGKASAARFFSCITQRQRSVRIPGKEISDGGSGDGINLDNLLAIRAKHVSVAERRDGGP